MYKQTYVSISTIVFIGLRYLLKLSKKTNKNENKISLNPASNRGSRASGELVFKAARVALKIFAKRRTQYAMNFFLTY
jgi:hypothetical protein